MPAKRSLSLALALLLAAAIPARATGVPTITVVDSIRPGADSSGGLGSSSGALDGYLYFSADDGAHTGGELWRTNGTTTELVEDINPGAGSNPGNFAALGSYIYFTADDGTHGYELWRSNGTTTELVEDIYAGSDNSNLN